MKTVNFIEAVNSGKKVSPIGCSNFYYTIKDLLSGDYTIEELVNTKFIIEEKSITITESEFDFIIKKYIDDSPFTHHCSIRSLKEDIGFTNE